MRALDGLSGQGAAFAAAGVPVLAVSVDPAEQESKVREATKGTGLSVALAGDEMAGAYSILSRYLFDRREDLRLPTLLLLDGQGAVVKVYRDQIDAGLVLADIPKIEAAPAERLARAVPFGGTFVTPPAERNDFQYSLELAEQGYENARRSRGSSASPGSTRAPSPSTTSGPST